MTQSIAFIRCENKATAERIKKELDNKMYLLMEKQHNRGQDGAGLVSLKMEVPPGTRYISRVRSNESEPIKDIFGRINNRLKTAFEKHPDKTKDLHWQMNHLPYIGDLFLGHVRYGTSGGNSIESVHPFLRQSNWRHKNLIVAGNFNLTNAPQLLKELVALGQHPKENTDAVTVMEKIGHFLDDEVDGIYQKIKERYSKKQASGIIGEQLDIQRILQRASKNFDGGYAMAGIVGHGDAFVMRDPSGIRPAFYYMDDEVVVITSERPVIQTVFNVPSEKIKEIEPGHAMVIKKSGQAKVIPVLPQLPKKSCSFERIYFSRGGDADIYKERKMLGKIIFPKILDLVEKDIDNTVFSYIPNTAETSFLGMIEAVEHRLNEEKTKKILSGGYKISAADVKKILGRRPRIEKIAIKDVKLRTFITEDDSREELVTHVYDCTYGVVKPTDHLVVIDDSIVRGTTLRSSIIKILDRLSPRHIVVASSAPQIRYPDCYGIDMSKIGDFIAFRAAIALLKESGRQEVIDAVYQKCIAQSEQYDENTQNFVKEIYAPFTDEEISAKIAELLKTEDIKAKVSIVYQSVEGLHKACPHHKGDWYFTGDYPTAGGNRVVNESFINYYEGKNKRAY
uniref:Putative amidophosphoribosyltransferase n=1 Tax=Stylophora pistillata TaxID=50429 RepID=A0A2B4R4H0_STYPI